MQNTVRNQEKLIFCLKYYTYYDREIIKIALESSDDRAEGLDLKPSYHESDKKNYFGLSLYY